MYVGTTTDISMWISIRIRGRDISCVLFMLLIRPGGRSEVRGNGLTESDAGTRALPMADKVRVEERTLGFFYTFVARSVDMAHFCLLFKER